ncbi:MAG: aspartate aminotransferase family protein [Sphaerochaetaceae bacterium]|nr:aspartate aminotransferase family protein [Sphaerochaetaceae bacterium]
MNRNTIIRLDREHIRRKDSFPFVIGDAKGSNIYDVNGKKYLDFMAGLYGCVSIGWKAKPVIDAITQQMNQFSFAPDRCPSEICSKLAREITKLTPSDLSVCLRATSGSEANDLVIKTVRASSDRTGFVAMRDAYHGQTIGSLSLGDKDSVKSRIGPLMPGVLRVNFPYCYRCKNFDLCSLQCLNSVSDVLAKRKIAALILEPVQGVGAIVPPKKYMKELRRICTENKVYLIYDEVITGFGRLGEMFATDFFNVKPDLMVLGKGLSSGYAPISSVVVSKKMSKELGGSGNTTTFGWNPVCAAAAYANIKFLIKNKLPQKAKKNGKWFKKRLEEFNDNKFVGEIRGEGLFFGIELVKNKLTKDPSEVVASNVYKESLKKGLFLATDGRFENTLMITPPLIITKSELDKGASIIEEILKDC